MHASIVACGIILLCLHMYKSAKLTLNPQKVFSRIPPMLPPRKHVTVVGLKNIWCSVAAELLCDNVLLYPVIQTLKKFTLQTNDHINHVKFCRYSDSLEWISRGSPHTCPPVQEERSSAWEEDSFCASRSHRVILHPAKHCPDSPPPNCSFHRWTASLWAGRVLLVSVWVVCWWSCESVACDVSFSVYCNCECWTWG